MATVLKEKSLENWLWDAACSIRGARDAPKFKDYILPLVFTKRLCDVYDDEINRIAYGVGSRQKAFDLVDRDNELVRFYLPFRPVNTDEEVWSVIRNVSEKIGETLTGQLRAIAVHNPDLRGIIDRVDFNATTHGVRDLDDARLSNLIEKISEKHLGLNGVEPDIIGRSYEFLIRKFAEGSVSSAGEFYTPKEVGVLMAKLMESRAGMRVYDPCCGSGGLLIKCQLEAQERSAEGAEPISLFGQESIPETWAMANMNMFIHGMQGQIELGDTMRMPKFHTQHGLGRFDRVVANPMWNQPDFTQDDYEKDKFNRFNYGIPPSNNADWGWIQHILGSLTEKGRAAVVLDTSSLSRGSHTKTASRERNIRKKIVDDGHVSSVILLPENLFYNTGAPGVIVVLSADPLSDVVLVNASREYKKGSPKNYIGDSSIDQIVDVIQNRKEVEGYSVVLPLEAIQSIDYDLSPERHIPIDPDLGELNYSTLESEYLSLQKTLSSIQARREQLREQASAASVEWKEERLKDVFIAEMSGEWGEELASGPEWVKCAIIRGTDMPKVRQGNLSSCPYRFVKEHRLLAKKPIEGDIIVETSGGGKYQNTGRIVLVDEYMENSQPQVMYSNFTKLLRPDTEKILPEYLFFYWDYLYQLGRTARYEKQPTNIKNFKLADFLASEHIRYPTDFSVQRLIAESLRLLFREAWTTTDISRVLGGMRLAMAIDLMAP